MRKKFVFRIKRVKIAEIHVKIHEYLVIYAALDMTLLFYYVKSVFSAEPRREAAHSNSFKITLGTC